MHFEERSCPVCGNQDSSDLRIASTFNAKAIDDFSFSSRKLPEYMNFSMAKCPDCSLLYATPVPGGQWYQQGYTQAHFSASKESEYAAVTYRRLLGKVLDQLPDTDKVLDIGAGDGAFMRQLVQLDFTQVQGVEPSFAPYEQADEEIRTMMVNDFFSPDDFEDDSFSLITCFQTLEHVREPHQLFTQVHRLLKTGGLFLIVGHNSQAVSAKILGTRSPIFDIEHLQLFCPESLTKIYNKTGFSEISVTSFRNTYPLDYWLKLMPFSMPIKRRLLKCIRILRLDELQVSVPAGNLWGVAKRL